MKIYEKEVSISKTTSKDLLSYLGQEITSLLDKENLSPLRLAVTETQASAYKCEVGVIEKKRKESAEEPPFFQFKKRTFENTKDFNVVFLVPTGIGCEIGGHAGDATATARLLASACDTLISHPNVFNASDINEMPENSLYVEGSMICRLLMGTIGLQPVRSNRVLVVIDKNEYPIFENAAINSVNAARATLSLSCPKILILSELKMESSYSSSQMAVGSIENIDELFSMLKNNSGEYDAVAISSIIKVPLNYHMDYLKSEGEMINPWGGVEAMLTHAVSHEFNVPSAHAPMFENPNIANMDAGLVDARLAAETVSTTFFHSVLKGLHKSPRIITDTNSFLHDGIISAEDISCLVIPENCLGLPTLAALEQGIKVIAVKENKNVMKNNLSNLPWKEGQFFEAENYLEAVGMLNAIRAGINLESVRRPFQTLNLSTDETELHFDKESQVLQFVRLKKTTN